MDELLNISQKRKDILLKKESQDSEDRKLWKRIIKLSRDIEDKVMIIAAFENILKAKLLLNGYLIHQINKKHNEKTKKWFQEQQKNPIKIKDIYQIENFKAKGLNDQRFLSLNRTTLGIEKILEEGYIKILGIPSEIISILKKIKTERNTLHFQVVRLYGIGFEDFKKYQRLRDYIEANIKPLINNLSLEFQKLRKNRNSLA